MAVEVGEAAPDFTLPDTDLQQVRLSDFRGHKVVVLVFYPFAFTRVCTGELCAIRDELPAFANDEVQVLSVSVDSPMVHRVFAEQESLNYPMLSDFWPHGGVAQAYGVFNQEIGVANRGTFIVDRDGIVRWKVLSAIPDARDLEEYKRVLAELTAA